MKTILNLIRKSAIYIAIANLVELCRSATHRHDWVYSSQVEEIGFGFNANRQSIKMNFKTRYCTKCGTKEKKIHANGTWDLCKLNKEEQRDKKLKELGI